VIFHGLVQLAALLKKPWSVPYCPLNHKEVLALKDKQAQCNGDAACMQKVVDEQIIGDRPRFPEVRIVTFHGLEQLASPCLENRGLSPITFLDTVQKAQISALLPDYGPRLYESMPTGNKK